MRFHHRAPHGRARGNAAKIPHGSGGQEQAAQLDQGVVPISLRRAAKATTWSTFKLAANTVKRFRTTWRCDVNKPTPREIRRTRGLTTSRSMTASATKFGGQIASPTAPGLSPNTLSTRSSPVSSTSEPKTCESRGENNIAASETYPSEAQLQ